MHSGSKVVPSLGVRQRELKLQALLKLSINPRAIPFECLPSLVAMASQEKDMKRRAAKMTTPRVIRVQAT
jgi:hypothetical protein